MEKVKQYFKVDGKVGYFEGQPVEVDEKNPLYGNKIATSFQDKVYVSIAGYNLDKGQIPEGAELISAEEAGVKTEEFKVFKGSYENEYEAEEAKAGAETKE